MANDKMTLPGGAEMIAPPRWARIVGALHSVEPHKDPGAAKVAMCDAADYIGRLQDRLMRLERMVKEALND